MYYIDNVKSLCCGMCLMNTRQAVQLEIALNGSSTMEAWNLGEVPTFKVLLFAVDM